jgi:type I restriction enzyme, R subunit
MRWPRSCWPDSVGHAVVFLKARLTEIADWRATEANRDAIRLTIHDYLYADATGLPTVAYDEQDVEALAAEVFQHVWRVYPTLPSPVYAMNG